MLSRLFTNPAPGQSVTYSKPVVIGGLWTVAPHILTRHSDGRLSDRPIDLPTYKDKAK